MPSHLKNSCHHGETKDRNGFKQIKERFQAKKNCCDKMNVIININELIDRLVFNPDTSKFYIVWVYYLSMVSIIQSFLYSIMITVELNERIIKPIITVLVIIEVSFIMEIVLESLKAFDISGQGVYETRWTKTSHRYWRKTYESKLSLFNMIPWGALGYVEGLNFLRILWLTKLYRSRLFLRVFRYQTYHKFFQSFINYRRHVSFLFLKPKT